MTIRRRSHAPSRGRRSILETDDGALVHMTSFVLRHGPKEVVAALARGALAIARGTTFAGA
jgi:hypothetical protein